MIRLVRDDLKEKADVGGCCEQHPHRFSGGVPGFERRRLKHGLVPLEDAKAHNLDSLVTDLIDAAVAPTCHFSGDPTPAAERRGPALLRSPTWRPVSSGDHTKATQRVSFP
jgi:hypothetical protein